MTQVNNNNHVLRLNIAILSLKYLNQTKNDTLSILNSLKQSSRKVKRNVIQVFIFIGKILKLKNLKDQINQNIKKNIHRENETLFGDLRQKTKMIRKVLEIY